MSLAGLAAISLLIWVYLLFARGNYWRVSRNLVEPRAASTANVTAIIPARDEAEHIGAAVRSLLQQSTSIGVVVVDDGSTDGTADIARATAAELGILERLEVISGKPLPEGWTGKLWAVSQGIEHARKVKPDYLLLTDADIVHGANSVAALAAQAERDGNDLTSLMVKLTCDSRAEKFLIPAFVFFFLQLYPPTWIQDAKSRTAGAAGGCMLVRPAALERIGGIAAIRKEVIDDCALASAIKRSGGSIWMGLTRQAYSVRPYRTFSEIGRMISRSAFNQLRHSVWLLVATVAGLLVTYVVPPVAMVSGNNIAASVGATAFLLMTASYVPTVRFYNQSWLWAFALPFVALFYLGATIHSAVRYWMGMGGTWKGRVQDIRG